MLVATNGSPRALVIDPRESGSGSSVNGGELLAVATCYCNDLYREAAARCEPRLAGGRPGNLPQRDAPWIRFREMLIRVEAAAPGSSPWHEGKP